MWSTESGFCGKRTGCPGPSAEFMVDLVRASQVSGVMFQFTSGESEIVGLVHIGGTNNLGSKIGCPCAAKASTASTFDEAIVPSANRIAEGRELPPSIPTSRGPPAKPSEIGGADPVREICSRQELSLQGLSGQVPSVIVRVTVADVVDIAGGQP